jgi:protein-S-isoprenylcysteine O-methyltransferase Ste14
MSLALPLIAQHWLVALLGIMASAAYYASTVYEEQACLDKFGESYARYMDRVPRMNAVLGIIRQLSRQGPGKG